MYFLFLTVFFVLRLPYMNGGCIHNTNRERLLCEAINQEDLIYSFNARSNNIHYLEVVNSNFGHIENLPDLEDYGYVIDLIIRNSSVMRIAPEALEGFFLLNKLDLSYNKIKRTNFLLQLKRIKVLDISHNEIDYLDGYNFNHLKNMQQLDLSFNNISNFSSIDLPIRFIDLSHNSLTDLKELMRNCSSLYSIDLSFNKLRILSANNFPDNLHLKYLNVDHNQLIAMDLAILRLDRWDYSIVFIFSNNNLKTMNTNTSDDESFRMSLDFSSNNVQSFDFITSGQKSFHQLSFRNNKINTLRGLKSKRIVTNFFDLSENYLTNVEPESFVNSSISSNLDLSRNKIKYLNSSNFKALRSLSSLNLSHNSIYEIEESTFNGLLSLELLDLSHCFLKTFDRETFSNLPNLDSLNLSFNVLETLPKGIFEENLRLSYLDLSHNSLSILPENIFSSLYVKIMDIGYNKFERFSENIFNNSKINHIIMTGNNFKEINQKDLVGLDSLISLNLSDSGVEILHHNSFDELKSLVELCLDNNKIGTIPKQLLKRRTKLNSLSLTGNNITDLNLGGFSRTLRLTSLNITLKGKLSEGRLQNLIYLKELNIIRSELTDITNGSFRGLVLLEAIVFENFKPPRIEPGAFIGLRSLKKFDAQIWFSSIVIVKSHQFSGLEAVTHLNLSNLGISTVENNAFVEMNCLEDLDLSFNNIKSLPGNIFSGLKTLLTLNLSRNKLTGEPSTFPIDLFKNLENLINLHLEYNEIVEITVGQFSNLNKLQFLNLSYNELSTLEKHQLFPLKYLRVLDINANRLRTLDYDIIVKYLPDLQTIGICSNRWECDKLAPMLNSFSGKGINYKSSSNLKFDVVNIGGIRCF